MKKYYLKQKVLSFRDRYKIFDENEVVQYHCEGQFFSIRNKMDFIKTSTDEVLYHFQRILLAFLPAYKLLDKNGNEVAVGRQKFSFMKKNAEIQSQIGDFTVDGNFIAHNFSIQKDGQEVASIQKKWLAWGDSYEILIIDEQNTEFLLALIIMIDAIFHSNKKKSR